MQSCCGQEIKKRENAIEIQQKKDLVRQGKSVPMKKREFFFIPEPKTDDDANVLH